MSEITTSHEEAKILSRSINGCVNELIRAGFSRSQIGPAMAGVGLAISHSNGCDFESVVSACREAISWDDEMTKGHHQ